MSAQTVTVERAAEMLGVGRSTLYRQITETGAVAPGVPAIHIRRRVVIPLAPLEQFLAGEAS